MEPAVKSITWEAPEHNHPEKRGDWFFALGILTVGVVLAAAVLGNFLFAVLAGLSGASLAIAATQPPKILQYGVGVRGVRVHETLHSYGNLRAYHIDDDHPHGPQLLLTTKKNFAPLIVIPIPAEYIDEIEDILATRLPAEYMEEPIFHKVLELVGF